jgi:hypothetical protein
MNCKRFYFVSLLKTCDLTIIPGRLYALLGYTLHKNQYIMLNECKHFDKFMRMWNNLSWPILRNYLGVFMDELTQESRGLTVQVEKNLIFSNQYSERLSTDLFARRRCFALPYVELT